MSVLQHVSVQGLTVQPYHERQITVTELNSCKLNSGKLNSGKLKHFKWGLYNVI
jgi:hypothetical protein